MAALLHKDKNRTDHTVRFFASLGSSPISLPVVFAVPNCYTGEKQHTRGHLIMNTILTLDAANYDPALPEIRREAVRGIIFRDGKLLLVRSCFGEVKFPGGGVEAGEDDPQTLIREVQEETGCHVLPETIRPFGQVVEKRLSVHEPMIWHQINRYYFCAVGSEQEECRYSENEKKHGFYAQWLPLEEALACNRHMLNREGEKPWNQREYRVLELLKSACAHWDTEATHL